MKTYSDASSDLLATVERMQAEYHPGLRVSLRGADVEDLGKQPGAAP